MDTIRVSLLNIYHYIVRLIGPVFNFFSKSGLQHSSHDDNTEVQMYIIKFSLSVYDNPCVLFISLLDQEQGSAQHVHFTLILWYVAKIIPTL